MNNKIAIGCLIQWYEIELEDGTTLRLTGNHRVYLPEKHCYRKEQL